MFRRNYKKKYEENPYYRKAWDFIKSHDFRKYQKWEKGTYFLDGEDVYVTIKDCQMRDIFQANFSAHNDHIEIHVPLSRAEVYGVKNRNACHTKLGGYDSGNDVQFYGDKIDDTVSIKPGKAIVFGPDKAYAPLIGVGTIRKAIFKVKIV